MTSEQVEKQRAEPNRTGFKSDLAIKRINPPKEGQVLYWDTGTKGLSLLIGSGGTKSFQSSFKLHGKWITRTIGRFGELTTEAGDDSQIVAAREVVRKDRALAAQGIDPREPKKPAPTSTRYENVVDQFIELYAKPRQRTWDQTQRALKINCKAWLNKPIGQITETDAYKVLDELVASGRGPTAALTLAWLRTFDGRGNVSSCRARSWIRSRSNMKRRCGIASIAMMTLKRFGGQRTS